MKRVTGIGGVFFKCNNTEEITNWYKEHLGLNMDNYGTNFMWRKANEPEKFGFTALAPFKETTKYFEPSQKEFMINFRVENIEELVKLLKTEGVSVLDEIETFDYGKFVHILDPEGNKIELWEANDDEYLKMICENKNY